MAQLAKITLMAALCVAAPALAQDSGDSPADFSLFEQLDAASTNNAASAANRNTQNNRGSRNTQAAPAFTLVGTSRIGNVETVLLKHLSGEVIRMPLDGDLKTIPGHELYSVQSHGSGQIALRFPAAVPCADFPELGVSCDSTTNVSSLSLTTADAIILRSTVAEEVVAEEEASEEATEATLEDAPRNPFAALRDRNRASSTNQAAPTSGFQPRRIDPADVPPGMRIVSTPFGDRLVNQ